MSDESEDVYRRVIDHLVADNRIDPAASAWSA